MNYETISDQKLNEKLASIVEFNYAEFTGQLGAGCVPSYCTDWSATMPLAVEHKIGLMFNWSVKDKWSAISSSDTNNENPLRAIVICLIKVLEEKK